MIPFQTIPPKSQVFSYRSETQGETIHLAAGVLRDFLLSYPGTEALLSQIPIEEKTYRQILTYSGVERHHLDKVKLSIAAAGPIALRHLVEPSIMIEWGADEIPQHLRSHTIADGNHRICALYELGHRFALVYLVPERLWREFLISNFPLSAEEKILSVIAKQEPLP